MPQTLPTVNPLALLLILGLLASVVAAWIWLILRFAFEGRVVPRFEPRLVPWGGKSVLLVLLAWLAIQFLVSYGFVAATHGTIERPGNGKTLMSPAEMMINSAIHNAVVLMAIPILLGATAGARSRDFLRLGRGAGWQVIQGVVAWPLAIPIVYGMMLTAVYIWGKESHPLETAIQAGGFGGQAIVFFLAAVVFAPAAEELIFRGVLLGWLSRLVLLASRPPANPDAPLAPLEPPSTPTDGHAGAGHAPHDQAAPHEVDDPYAPPRSDLHALATIPETAAMGTGVAVRLGLANVGVSLLFGALHYTVWPTPVPIFFLSLVLGFLYQWTGSLVAPVTLHMTFNGVSTVLMFLTLSAAPGPVDPRATPVPTPIPKPVDPITKPISARTARSDVRKSVVSGKRELTSGRASVRFSIPPRNRFNS